MTTNLLVNFRLTIGDKHDQLTTNMTKNMSTNLFVNFWLIISNKGRFAEQHFVDEDAESPQIHRLAVTKLAPVFSVNNLGGLILGRAAEGIRCQSRGGGGC